MPIAPPRPTTYQTLIAEATGAPADCLAILENIMRNQVFDGVLDWQSSRQFNAGARRALQIFLKNRQLYETEQAFHQARWLRIEAEAALRAAQSSADPDAMERTAQACAAAQADEAAALAAFDACLGLR